MSLRRRAGAAQFVHACDGGSTIDGGPGTHVGAYRGVTLEYDPATASIALRQSDTASRLR